MDGTISSAVLGTAGHIDHGKSSLVKALTGTDPDRFKEEQERGMTIDIGFAEYRTADGVDVGLIDVPGHERFVRNMVAGAVGMDVVMLVVACDDGVMPQTREHLEIMTLLGLQRGFIVLTKIDMVEPEMIELVEEEVAEFVEGTFLEGSPMLRVSSVAGIGIDAVKSRIDELVRTLPPRDRSGVFRMPIQRSFTLRGHGTVVTGVPVSGEIEVGDAVEILPRRLSGRVRSLQAHHRPVTTAGAGHRTALNVSDVNYRDVVRGDVIAEPGFFSPTRLVEARFRLLPSHGGSLRSNVPVRFHVGCTEAMGRLVLLDRKVLEPGEDGLVQIRLEADVVVAPGDHYLVRLASPERTLGGGLVLGETRFRFKRFKDWVVQNLAGKEASLADQDRYLEYVIRSGGLHPMSTEQLPVLAKESAARVTERLDALARNHRVEFLPGNKEVLHVDMVERGAEEAEKALAALHAEDHYPFGFSAQRVAARMKHSVPLVKLFLERALKQGRLDVQWDLHRARSFGGGLSKEDRKLMTLVEDALVEGGYATPIPAELAESLDRPKKRIENTLTLLEGYGRAMKLADNVYLHRRWVVEARDRLVAYCLEHGSIPSNKMKDVVDASRKYVIPLLEYFDRVGLTHRRESERVLTPDYASVLTETREGAETPPIGVPPAGE